MTAPTGPTAVAARSPQPGQHIFAAQMAVQQHRDQLAGCPLAEGAAGDHPVCLELAVNAPLT